MKRTFILTLLVVLTSCLFFPNRHTHHRMRIDNESSDTIRVIVQGDSIDNRDEILLPRDVDYRSGHFYLYLVTYYDSITERITQNQFNIMIDSFSVYKKVGGEWEHHTLPEFWSFEYWTLYEHSDDEYLNFSYYFNITDSLLNR